MVLPTVTTSTFKVVVVLSSIMGMANAWHRASKQIKPGFAFLCWSIVSEMSTSVYDMINSSEQKTGKMRSHAVL